MSECSGQPGCERHPHIPASHPTGPVTLTGKDGWSITHNYSDGWEEAEAEWERISGSPEGRAYLDSLRVEGP